MLIKGSIVSYFFLSSSTEFVTSCIHFCKWRHSSMMSRMVIKSPPLRFLKAKEDVGDEEERHEMEDEETSNSMEFTTS